MPPDSPAAPRRVVLAFSGGLDTSWCVLHLIGLGAEVVTVTVDTGGLDEAERRRIGERAGELGASRHVLVDARDRVYEDHVSWLIRANARRGGVYPLCVGAERVVQARTVARVAREVCADAVAHGSTGAGNDQIRFDVALRALLPDLPVLTPIRDLQVTRERSAGELRAAGFPVRAETRDYSVNRGLWGTTIGGRETHDPWASPPPSAWPDTVDPDGAPPEGVEVVLGFRAGLPVSLGGEPLAGVPLVERLNHLGAAHGIGRGIHLGDTILGIKGRIAFEAPAAAVLIDAHRELEKLVLTRLQAHHKDQLAAVYGMLLHEGQYFDPVMRDIEAFLASSQRVVEGDARVLLRRGRVEVRGVRSPYSLMDEAVGRYGEDSRLWSGEDARGFARLYGLQGVLAERARRARP
ncbi:argininosuccinate synthase [Myxococcota bacterium]|nr:argininosuccinate synthase [Myxococcota bacterium]